MGPQGVSLIHLTYLFVQLRLESLVLEQRSEPHLLLVVGRTAVGRVRHPIEKVISERKKVAHGRMYTCR